MATRFNKINEELDSLSGVSVIICCYNSEQTILETLTYLGAQQLDARFSIEVILVDNVSTDATVEVAQRYWEENQSNAIPLSFT